MHVGLNLIYLVPGETGGTETYARALAAQLPVVAPGIRLTAFVNRETAADRGGPWGRDVDAITVPVRARRRTEWVLGEQLLLPRLARRAGVDLVHSLASTAPLRGAFARVTTIHDLIHRRYPEAHRGILSHGMRLLVGGAARRSDRVIVDAASTRADLVNLLGVPAGRIDVVPLAVDDPQPPPPGLAGELRRRHGIGERPIVLSVSAKRAHKNLPALLDALALIPPERRPVVVVPGYPTPHEQELAAHARRLGITADVRLLPWIPRPDLEALYATAACAVYPTLYEGFCLPIVEAMTRGVPVACTDRGSLPEVAGDAAVPIDPGSPVSIAAAIETLLTDEGERDRRRGAGHVQAARFSWAATARGTAAAYECALA